MCKNLPWIVFSIHTTCIYSIFNQRPHSISQTYIIVKRFEKVYFWKMIQFLFVLFIFYSLDVMTFKMCMGVLFVIADHQIYYYIPTRMGYQSSVKYGIGISCRSGCKRCEFNEKQKFGIKLALAGRRKIVCNQDEEQNNNIVIKSNNKSNNISRSNHWLN